MERAMNNGDNCFHSLDVEEVVWETLKDDLDLLQTELNVYCDITADELIELDLDACITDKSSDEDIIAEIYGLVIVDDEGKSNEEELMMLQSNK